MQQSKTDEWYTPQYAVDVIKPYNVAGGYKSVLCPFDTKESNFVKTFTEIGMDVTMSHIETGTDFFSIQDFSKYDCIVSNPPFSKRDMVFKRLFETGKPFAMIMNFNGLFDSKARYELFSKNKFELLIPRGRINFINPNISNDSPNFQSIYVCKDILPEQIVFCEMDKS